MSNDDYHPAQKWEVEFARVKCKSDGSGFVQRKIVIGRRCTSNVRPEDRYYDLTGTHVGDNAAVMLAALNDVFGPPTCSGCLNRSGAAIFWRCLERGVTFAS